MIKKYKFLILFAAIFTFQSCGGITNDKYYKGYETPEYKVLKQVNNIEIRSYKSNLVAEVEVYGNRKEAAKKGFRILAGYIFGKNQANQKLAMTSPVVQEEIEENKSEKIAMTAPVSQINQKEGKWLVQFNMPSKYNLSNLPKPKDSRIKFKLINPKKMVAIKFSGRWSDEIFSHNQQILIKFIKENNLSISKEPIFAYYDDPFTFPWNRRNEVLWEVVK